MIGPAQDRAELRLRVLNALPRRHQDFFYSAVRSACRNYIASLGTPVVDRDSHTLELFSEVMAKLLGATSRADHPEPVSDGGPAASEMPHWTIDETDPRKDGRVAWLIDEAGGARSLSHRFEDIRRQRWGRWQSSGYRTVQMEALQKSDEGEAVEPERMLAQRADGSVELHSDPDVGRETDEMRLAWSGLLVLAEKQFAADDDVFSLLRLLDQDSDIQAGFGSEWPIGQIVRALNADGGQRPWTDDRVDNAKRRVRNWLTRIQRDQSLDRTDLLALLVRCARRKATQDVRTTAVAERPQRMGARHV